MEAVRGGLDFHVHTGPDAIPRKHDDLQVARGMRRLGLAGFVIKSHHAPTAARAALLDDHLNGIRLFGGVCLNHAVGGLNPLAVDAAGRAGGRVAWLPTIDAANERAATALEGNLAPSWARAQHELEERGLARDPIALLGADGTLVPEAFEIIALAHEHHMVLATGHISGNETFAVARACQVKGVRVLVSHPEYPTINLSVAQQRELVALNVTFERCYSTAATGKAPWGRILEGIRETGPAFNILASDLGQLHGIDPAAGLANFAEALLEAGLAPGDVRAMAVDNPWRLIG